MSSESWYVAKAKPVSTPYRYVTGSVIPHAYRFAMRRLESQDFTVFCPTTNETWIWRGKRWLRERPVFPSYLFIAFDVAQDRWRSINGTHGIVHLLPLHAEEPQPVPEGFVEELRHRQGQDPQGIEGVVQLYEKDAIVRILAGALRDRVGRVLSSSRQSTRVAVQAFAGREVIATVPTAVLVVEQ